MNPGVSCAPAVSVVMPVYKPDFLAAAIESVLAQTMPDLELIMVNDGSPHKRVADITAAFAAKDSRVRCLRQNNMGAAAARNTGAAEARAPYLMLMDDDDISLPERAECQLRFLQAHSQVAAVSCAYVVIDTKGDVCRKYNGGRPIPTLSETVIKHPAPSAVSSITTLGASTMMRKAAYDDIGGMRVFFRFLEDADFFHRLEERFTVAVMPQAMYQYRSNPRQTSKNIDMNLYGYAVAYAAHCRRRGERDIIGDTPPLATVLLRGAESGFMPRKMAWKAMKVLLLKKDYGVLRVFLNATTQGGDWKLRLKLAYASLVKNRLGFWFSRNGGHTKVAK